MCRCVKGHDADVVFEMLEQLVELFLAAVAVCKDLHLVRNPLRHPRLDVVQVDPLFLQGEEEKAGSEGKRWRE